MSSEEAEAAAPEVDAAAPDTRLETVVSRVSKVFADLVKADKLSKALTDAECTCVRRGAARALSPACVLAARSCARVRAAPDAQPPPPPPAASAWTRC